MKMSQHRTVKDIPEYLDPEQVHQRYIVEATQIPYARSIRRLRIRDKALVAFLYMTGLRISEALSVLKRQVYWDLEPNFVLFKGIKILKHRKKVVFRDKAVALDGAMKPFVDVFRQHYERVKRNHALFEVGRARAFRIVRALTGEWPHYFRSQHISYLVNYCELSTLMVADIMGIANVQTLRGYAHSSWKLHREALSR